MWEEYDSSNSLSSSRVEVCRYPTEKRLPHGPSIENFMSVLEGVVKQGIHNFGVPTIVPQNIHPHTLGHYQQKVNLVKVGYSRRKLGFMANRLT